MATALHDPRARRSTLSDCSKTRIRKMEGQGRTSAILPALGARAAIQQPFTAKIARTLRHHRKSKARITGQAGALDCIAAPGKIDESIAASCATSDCSHAMLALSSARSPAVRKPARNSSSPSVKGNLY